MSPIGRFAPTPSGDLHFGSLIGALGSYLSVKSKGGKWRLRIDDLDRPRVVKGSVNSILKTLEIYGLWWDGPVRYQSQRLEAYQTAFEQLRSAQQVYFCSCSRKEVEQKGKMGPEGPIYPQSCRHRALESGASVRVKTQDQSLVWQDLQEGPQEINLARQVGDFVVWRREQIPSYHLACVVDEQLDQITEVVRGRDLLTSTSRQFFLQHLLGYAHPDYLHLPLAINHQGDKLSKQNQASALSQTKVIQTLYQALQLFWAELPKPEEYNSVHLWLAWATAHWDQRNLAQQNQIFVDPK